jgi:hypothetical protein
VELRYVFDSVRGVTNLGPQLTMHDERLPPTNRDTAKALKATVTIARMASNTTAIAICEVPNLRAA